MARNRIRFKRPAPAGLLALALAAGGVAMAPGAAAAATKEKEPMRYFVGLDLAPAPHEALRVLADELRRLPAPKPLSWSPPPAYHLTLRFLGELDAPTLDAIAAALEVVAQAEDTRPFSLDLHGLGSFPWRGKGGPRVLWAGLAEPHPQLDALATRIDEAVRHVGLPAADYPFNPHVTLARAPRHAVTGELAAALARLADVPMGSWSVEGFVLYQANRPDPRGGYVALRRFRLR